MVLYGKNNMVILQKMVGFLIWNSSYARPKAIRTSILLAITNESTCLIALFGYQIIWVIVMSTVQLPG